MNSKLEFVSTAQMDRETWLAFRHSGIGASEVGTILGLDDYTSSLELYYYKIGDSARLDTESIFQFMGRYSEDMIADLWQYWDGSEETIISNYKAGKVVRRCQRVNGFVRNPEFPWLYVSLDRKINKTENRGEGALELKTISSWEADKWEAGIPVKYVPQLNTQMLVCEFAFGEMALLQDGRRFFVIPFTPSPVIQNQIIERTKDFWNRVIEGRRLVNAKYQAQLDFNLREVERLDAKIDELAPPPDGSLAYAEFLKKKYKRPASSERKGTESEFTYAGVAAQSVETLKMVTETKTEAESILKKAMGDQFQVLDFGERGKVYWTMNGAGNRVFRNKIKL